MESKITKLTNEEFIDLVKSSRNTSEVLFKLGYTVEGNSWGYSQVKARMSDLNLSGKDFRGMDVLKQINDDSKDLFIENSKTPRITIKKRIIKENLIPYKCAICGISEWQGKPISLELDHINGVNNDHRLENLRFLCPNCHSQTVTYGSKNRKDKEIKYEIDESLKEKIIEEYIKIKNQKKVSENLNIKRKIVKEVIDQSGLSRSNQKYVIQYDKNMNEINRFGTISECCEFLINNNMVKTKILKTCRNTLIRNSNKLWNNFYFKIINS